ncbi:hypothetical protein E4U13_004069, partial [Claviceps humidiphila]
MLTDLKSQACHKPILGLTVDSARNAEANTEGAPPESRLRQGRKRARISCEYRYAVPEIPRRKHG